MEPVNVKILGISGTVIKDGNCDTLVKEALKGAEEIGGVAGGVETEFITLADKEIALCKHCQWCIENRQPCKIKDDFHMVSDKIEQCDGLILGGPCWFATLSPPLLILWSRFRSPFFFTRKFRDKPTGAVSLGFFGFGVERALDVIQTFSTITMGIFVGGAYALASTAAFGQRPAYLEHGVIDDTQGIRRVRMVGQRVVEVARMIKYATENGIVLPDEYRMRTALGARVRATEDARGMELVDGVWRERK